MRDVTSVENNIPDALHQITSVKQKRLMIEAVERLAAYLQADRSVLARPLRRRLALHIFTPERIETANHVRQICEIARDGVVRAFRSDRFLPLLRHAVGCSAYVIRLAFECV